MQITIIGGKPGIFTWADGFRARRAETYIERARQSEDDLLQVCLWLENHGQKEEAVALLDRLLPF